MADTPPPMASHTCPRSLGEIVRNMPPRPNMENARTIMTIPLSASARRTAAAKVLNWYLSRGLTAGWKRIGEFAGRRIARPTARQLLRAGRCYGPELKGGHAIFEVSDTRDNGCLIPLMLAPPLPVGFREAVERLQEFRLRAAERLDQAIFHRLQLGADFCDVLLGCGLIAVFHTVHANHTSVWHRNARVGILQTKSLD